MHIPDDPMYYEKFYFTPGDVDGKGGGFRVFRTRYANVGVLVCWDQWYPEAARITALQGAEILFYPTAIGWHPEEKEQFGEAQADAWRTVQRGHAISNGIYVGAANRVGHEPEEGTDGIQFFGRSFICDPFGRMLGEASSTDSEVLVTECSRRHLEKVRRNWPFFRDRRIDAYQPITRRFIQSDDS
jgi:N-carbamoylputrescine amidase